MEAGDVDLHPGPVDTAAAHPLGLQGRAEGDGSVRVEQLQHPGLRGEGVDGSLAGVVHRQPQQWPGAQQRLVASVGELVVQGAAGDGEGAYDGAAVAGQVGRGRAAGRVIGELGLRLDEHDGALPGHPGPDGDAGHASPHDEDVTRDGGHGAWDPPAGSRLEPSEAGREPWTTRGRG